MPALWLLVVVGVAIVLVVWLLWRYASRIEADERLEKEWGAFIAEQERLDPHGGAQWRQYYQQMRGR